MTSMTTRVNFLKRGQNSQTVPLRQDLIPSQNDIEYDVIKFFDGKTLFCTGITGFLGKALLEKILREVNAKKIFVLMRPKKTLTVGQRLEKEIFHSRIFDRLRQEKGDANFEAMFREKVHPIAGDVANDNYFTYEDDENDYRNAYSIMSGNLNQHHNHHSSSSSTTNGINEARDTNGNYKMNKQLLEYLKNEVQVIIHVAATIGFHERLDKAIRLNTFGPLRTLKFAQQCKNLESFCHVSTAYVNSNLKNGSTVIEAQYTHSFPQDESIESFCERVLQMDLKDIEKTNRKILKHFNFPNTYTFTKWMAEQLVVKNRQDVPVSIVRPSIIGCALKDPVPGWIDAVSAGGAVFFFSGLGIVTLARGIHDNIADQIPVDFVVNALLITTAAIGIEGKQLKAQNQPTLLRTFHVGTSSKNPTNWIVTKTGIIKYWESHRPTRAIADPSLMIIQNDKLFLLRFFLSYTVITKIYQLLALVTQNPKYIKLAKGLQFMEARTKFIDKSFRHFTFNEWVFDVSNLEVVHKMLPTKQKDIFFMNFQEIEWQTYFQYYGYGLHKFVLKEDPSPPTQADITRTNMVDWFSDIAFAYGATGEFNNRRSRAELMESVLSSSKVQNAIQLEAESRSLKFADVEERAKEIMDQMFANPRPAVIRILGWLFRKIWRSMYQSILVNDDEITKVRSMIENESTGPLIIIPTHRSYIDFLILSYIFFAYNIPIPHIAAGEDFLNMLVVRDLFRYSGAFFLRRQFGGDELYKCIFSEYVKELLSDHCGIEFFVEGTRSRSGKTLQPKMGLLSIITESFLEKRISNMTILPVYIGYEKLLESEAYSNELTGQSKKRETLENLIKAGNVVFNRYGTINVRFGKPILLKEYTESMMQKSKHDFDPFLNNDHKKSLVTNLAYTVAHELNSSSVIMPSSLIATVILMYRNGISHEEMTNKVLWLKKQIEIRGGTIHWNTGELNNSTSSVIERSLKLLSNVLAKKNNLLEPRVTIMKQDYKPLIQLHIYRNQIIHLFAAECIVCCSLASVFQVNKPVNKQLVIALSQFIEVLCKKELVLSSNPDYREDFDQLLCTMEERGILELQKSENGDTLVSIPPNSMEAVYCLCTMYWPYIEGYWTTALSLYALQNVINEQSLLQSSVPIDLDFNAVQLTDEEKELGCITESSFYHRVQFLSEKLFMEGKVLFYEGFITETIKNAVESFVSLRVVQRLSKEVKKQVKGKEVISNVKVLKLVPPYNSLQELVNLCGQIGRFRKETSIFHRNLSVAGGTTTPTTTTTSSINSVLSPSLPITSKL